MPLFLRFLALVAHAALILGAAPLVAGIGATATGRLLGRRPPPPAQPYRELQKLLRKVPPVPDNATALYPLWPFITLAATTTAALVTPSFCLGMATASLGDVVTFIGLLALARAATILAGLETGSGQGGAAAARATLLGIFTDATMLVAVTALALAGHSPTIDGIGAGLRHAPPIVLIFTLPAILAAASSQIGEASPGEYAGRFLALFGYAAMLRLTLWLSLIATVYCPYGMGQATSPLTWLAGLVLWPLKLAALIAALALVQSRTARLAQLRTPAVLAATMLLSLLAALFLFVAQSPAR